jgi:hypothetical protein
MTTDDVLARLGLQTRTSTADYLLPALGVFGAGMMLGAGLGLLFAPRPGSEMRAEIGRQAGRLGKPIRRVMDRLGHNGEGGEDFEQMSRDELYELARERGVEGRGRMSRQELIEAVAGSH